MNIDSNLRPKQNCKHKCNENKIVNTNAMGSKFLLLKLK
jgi:hypothetical protein